MCIDIEREGKRVLYLKLCVCIGDLRERERGERDGSEVVVGTVVFSV